jgi:nicotinamide-nucleotide adenylyltransferase
MRCLVLGRFQPLHLGHVRMIEYAASKADELVIGIGSSNAPRGANNPFTLAERRRMLKASLKLEVPYTIVGIPDFGDDKKWLKWIMENVEFDSFMTNAENERRIFRKAGIKVLKVPFYRRPLYWATKVRKRMQEGGDWEGLLPPGTAKVLKAINGVKKIKNVGEESSG